MPRSFTPEHLERAVPVALTWLHGSVMECRGRQALHEHQRPEVLETLRQTAIIQSAESSNRIEGVVVDADRLGPLVRGSATPRDRPEEEVVGYCEALSLIHEHYGDHDVSAETLRTLHRVSQAGMVGDAGEWKTRPNDIIELFPDGRREVRFAQASDAESAIEGMNGRDLDGRNLNVSEAKERAPRRGGGGGGGGRW